MQSVECNEQLPPYGAGLQYSPIPTPYLTSGLSQCYSRILFLVLRLRSQLFQETKSREHQEMFDGLNEPSEGYKEP